MSAARIRPWENSSKSGPRIAPQKRLVSFSRSMALRAKRHVSRPDCPPGSIPIGVTNPTIWTAGAVAREKGACTTAKMGIFPTCESPSDASRESIESGFAKSNRKRWNRPFPLGPVRRHDRRPGPAPPGARPATLPPSARDPRPEFPAAAAGSRCIHIGAYTCAAAAGSRCIRIRQVPGAYACPVHTHAGAYACGAYACTYACGGGRSWGVGPAPR